MRRLPTALLLLPLATACTSPAEPAALHDETAWVLSASGEGQARQLAKHLRGLDVAMVEVGYRYAELAFAARDGNWPHAEYQVGKIELAMANALQRRPWRAPSARMMDPVLRQVRAAIQAGDPQAFASQFEGLTASCNACHQAEKVAFLRVRAPTQRLSVLGPVEGTATVAQP